MPVTYAASTELDAVNQILSSVGQAPVTTLDLQNPEVAIVLTTLREVSKQVQTEGWMFNQERSYTLKPDSTTEEILYPTNALQIDTNVNEHRDDYDVVRRGNKLYDRLHHTFKFKKKPKKKTKTISSFPTPLLKLPTAVISPNSF